MTADEKFHGGARTCAGVRTAKFYGVKIALDKYPHTGRIGMDVLTC